jgi:hypothetical protein
MQSYDNNGKLQSEINTSYTSDGRVITTVTTRTNGKLIGQHITVRNLNNGRVSSEFVYGGKLLP